MALIISIETATTVCSVAIHKNGTCIALSEISEKNAHSSQLTVLLETMLRSHSLQIADCSAIAISQGPGSYTGLRIGTSVAKGLCYAANIPLIAVDTLQALALQAKKKHDIINTKSTILCPMIDARRMEVYTAEFSYNLQSLKSTYPLIVTENTVTDFHAQNTYYLFGDGSQKLTTILHQKNILYIPNITNSAESVGELAQQKFLSKDFVDVAYFTPFYLKKFQTTTPKKQI
ncbi:MAG TPA: tRNA (adenosine(37)-N6)-threonylcarbamoyltransferase complex dimerization subunit type 1 TsaB [Bacteroidales bacterium]|nr:tRNA (adenosine(37)-N6)-threonylcarbamoyltransferase complex dimerization subunit type 1 TsaB [Bacteroidales bacterium]